jgi:hypothetical protein
LGWVRVRDLGLLGEGSMTGDIKGDARGRRWLRVVGGDGATGRVVEDIRWAVSVVGAKVAVVRNGGRCGGGGRWAGRRGGVGAAGRRWWWRSAATVLVRRKKGDERKSKKKRNPEEEEREGKR